MVGLDLSLRAAAACALPLDWDGDLRRVRMMVCGSPLTKTATAREFAERNAQIAHDVVVFCQNQKAKMVLCEAYAFSQRSTSAHVLAELGGVVKHELLSVLDLEVESVTASHARKVLLQRLPRKGSKDFTIRNVRRLGPIAEAWTEDECDAFSVGNVALMRAGGVALTFAGE